MKMSFVDKIKDVTRVSSPKKFPHWGSNEIFVANIVKISTFNKDVFDSDVSFRLVCSW